MTSRRESQAELERWQLLEQLLDVAERDVAALQQVALRDLARLYRQATLDLARHQRLKTPGATIPYLNALVLRGHRVIYRRQRPGIRWIGVWELLVRDFPRMLLRERQLFALTALIFTMTGVGGYAAMAHDPAWVRSLYPQLFLLMESQGYGDQVNPGALASGNIAEGEEASAAAYITANNIRVSILCYGAGATLGLGTLYFLAMNGTLVGAVAWYYLSRGATFQEYFYAGILPHGVWELTAIVISAMAGLMLGRALIFPGDQSRTAALRLAALDTLPLMGGVIAMLLVARFIEGYVTPSSWPSIAKIGFGLGSGVVFWGYVFVAGRSRVQIASRR